MTHSFPLRVYDVFVIPLLFHQAVWAFRRPPWQTLKSPHFGLVLGYDTICNDHEPNFPEGHNTKTILARVNNRVLPQIHPQMC